VNRKIFVAVTVGIVLLGAAVVLLRKPTSTERPVKAGTRQVNPYTWVVSRADKEAYLSDLVRVTKDITLKPTPGKEENSVAELTIAALAEGSPMYAAGFRKDDRILKVNGTPVVTLGRAINLVHEIKSSDRITVQVQRGGKLIDYRVDVE
jgi:S1-C subfamily serine protease